MDSTALLTLQSADFMRSEAAQARLTRGGARSGLPAAGASGNAAQTSALTASVHNKLSAKNAALGQRFEAMALSNLLSPMWDGLKSDGPFGGGEGEEAMKSFYIDAIANQMAKKGGVGISSMMQKELLKLQGAS